MTRIEQIIAALEERGPMTATQIASAVGISEKATNTFLLLFRRSNKGIRISGYMKVGQTKPHRIYAIGDAPDAQNPNTRRAPSRLKKMKYPAGMTREEIAEHKRKVAALANMKPFRHWQDVALFGGVAA